MSREGEGYRYGCGGGGGKTVDEEPGNNLGAYTALYSVWSPMGPAPWYLQRLNSLCLNCLMNNYPGIRPSRYSY